MKANLFINLLIFHIFLSDFFSKKYFMPLLILTLYICTKELFFFSNKK